MTLRNKNNQINYRGIVVLVFLSGVLFVIGRWVYASLEKKHIAQEALDKALAKQIRLEVRLEEVESRNQDLETDTGIQDFLVKRKGLIRAGERVLILVEDEQTAQQQIEKEQVKNWWQRLWD